MRIALLLLVACAEQPLSIEDLPCPTSGTTYTYENFGAQFLATHCNSCHSMARNGAPVGSRFDTLDEVMVHKDRIFLRAAGPNVSMPPGPDDPPAAERDKLAEWLACGAP